MTSVKVPAPIAVFPDIDPTLLSNDDVNKRYNAHVNALIKRAIEQNDGKPVVVHYDGYGSEGDDLMGMDDAGELYSLTEHEE